MSFVDEIDKLAVAIAQKASEKDTSLQESTDALKVLTQYYAVSQKRKFADEPDEGANFDNFSATVNGAQEEHPHNGRPAVRDRRNPS